MTDTPLNPITPVTAGALVSASNPLPVYVIGGGGTGTVVVNTTPITGGTTGRFLYDNAGTVGEALFFSTPSDGVFKLTNYAGTSGVTFNVGADGILTIQTRAGGTGGNLSATGYVLSNGGEAIVAGGDLATGFFATSASQWGVFFGSGAPTITASKGSLYLRSDGTTTNNRMYVNTDGGTTWTAVTTVA